MNKRHNNPERRHDIGHEYEEGTRNKEGKEFSERDFGHQAQEAAKRIINKLPRTEVLDSSPEEDQFEKVDFWVRSEGLRHDLPVQFTIMKNPCERFGKKRESELSPEQLDELSEKEKEQLEKLEQKATECENRGVEFWSSPASYYKKPCREYEKKRKEEPDLKEDAIADLMDPEGQIGVASDFTKSLNRDKKKTFIGTWEAGN